MSDDEQGSQTLDGLFHAKDANFSMFSSRADNAMLDLVGERNKVVNDSLGVINMTKVSTSFVVVEPEIEIL